MRSDLIRTTPSRCLTAVAFFAAPALTLVNVGVRVRLETRDSSAGFLPVFGRLSFGNRCPKAVGIFI